MLSRIANNLFWMGRYIERTEHMARYTNVNYFSALDTPLTIERGFVLNSILRMNGQPGEEAPEEHNVLHSVTFDPANPNSVFNNVVMARENARGARAIISTELWEAINKYYHFIKNYSSEAYVKTHLFDFSQNNIERIAVIKGRTEATLLHNETWAIINLGMTIERCLQVLRALSIKLDDLKELESQEEVVSMYSHQVATLLRGIEAFDMSRKHYKRAPNLSDALEFLILTKNFPRSVLGCLKKIRDHVLTITQVKVPENDSSAYMACRRYAEMRYLSVKEVEKNSQQFIQNTYSDILKIAEQMEKDYFTT